MPIVESMKVSPICLNRCNGNNPVSKSFHGLRHFNYRISCDDVSLAELIKKLRELKTMGNAQDQNTELFKLS